MNPSNRPSEAAHGHSSSLLPINGNGNGDGNGDGEDPPEPTYNSNLRIVGLEVTQGVQFFNFNGLSSGAGADNAIPLVRNKTTVFRVYVDRGTSPSFPIPSTITGRLEAFRIHSPPVSPNDRNSLDPINAPIPAQPASQVSRGAANDTLNFRLDGWLSRGGNTGKMAIGARVWDAARSSSDLAHSSAPFPGPTITFPHGNRLPVHVVRIIYTGPGVGAALGPPTETAMTETLSNSFVSTTYPISGINYVGSTIEEFNGDLRVPSADGSGGCGPGWAALLSRLSALRSASSSNAVFVGLLPATVPLANVGGCGGGMVAAAREFDPVALAHEIGHAYGRKHAPPPPPPACGAATQNIDPSYPAYGTFPAGSIGEFGFDTGFSNVFDPSTVFDFMGNCPPRWVSPYTYYNLYYALLFAAGWPFPYP